MKHSSALVPLMVHLSPPSASQKCLLSPRLTWDKMKCPDHLALIPTLLDLSKAFLTYSGGIFVPLHISLSKFFMTFTHVFTVCHHITQVDDWTAQYAHEVSGGSLLSNNSLFIFSSTIYEEKILLYLPPTLSFKFSQTFKDNL